MSMYALLRSAKGKVTQHDIEDALAGNLCRCTGYRPIMDAFEPFTQVDTSVYTDDAIQRRAAAVPADTNGHAANGRNGASNGHATNGKANGAANGATNGGVKICPSTGKPCDCSGDSTAPGKSEIEALCKGPLCEPIFPPALASGEHAALELIGPDLPQPFSGCALLRTYACNLFIACVSDCPAQGCTSVSARFSVCVFRR